MDRTFDVETCDVGRREGGGGHVYAGGNGGHGDREGFGRWMSRVGEERGDTSSEEDLKGSAGY